nr:MAG TPA: hypothetical protein [Caudoviricetes sp.]DAR44315.1 MAG TPA: hypothetical protein [Caudoviricetes sp.]
MCTKTFYQRYDVGWRVHYKEISTQYTWILIS